MTTPDRNRGPPPPADVWFHEKLGWLTTSVVAGWVEIRNQKGKLLNRHKETQMSRLRSDFEGVEKLVAVPKDVYTLRLALLKPTRPYQGNTSVETSKAGNPMLVFEETIVEGKESGRTYSGRKLRDYIVVGGKDKNGDNAVSRRYFELIEASEILWACSKCNVDSARPFYWGRGQEVDGLKKGTIACPDCKQPMAVDLEPSEFNGKLVLGAVDVSKREGSDDEQNNVKSYHKLI